MVNESSNICTPEYIINIAKKLAYNKKITCSFLDKKDLFDQKLNLLISVNKGSNLNPYLLILNYSGSSAHDSKIALIGKVVTFDSGGLNLKPTGYIEEMKLDMAGAATVLYTMKSIAELNLNKNVTAIIPLTENTISGNAYKPGDVLKSFSGKTVEVINTDAEGRLILADAMAYAEKHIKPDYLIDIATLTGEAIETFGEIMAPYFTENKKLSKLVTSVR